MELVKSIRKKDDHIYYYLKWLTNDSKRAIVISHGMAEHPARYNEFALFLNGLGYDVYALFLEGHGEVHKDSLGHFEKDGFLSCVLNLDDLIINLKNDYQNVILFGHSMGSFVSQEYLNMFSKHIDACILCGTSSPTFSIKLASILSNLLYLLPGKNKPSKFLNKLGFSGYNKEFQPQRTEFDWLSKNQKNVDDYIADPYCGYICTRGFFKSFASSFSKLHKKKKLKNIRKDIPIFIIGGSKDPVSNNGEGLRTLLVRYKEQNIIDVNLKIYDDLRHEILKENEKDMIYNDIKDWLGTIFYEEN